MKPGPLGSFIGSSPGRVHCPTFAVHEASGYNALHLSDGISVPPPGGRTMEMLSEHKCQGWLEGYLLTGRHGCFSCYEAFIHIVNSNVQPERQMAEDLQSHSLASTYRLAELPIIEPCLAAGSKRRQPSKTSGLSTTSSTRGPGDPRVIHG